MEIRFGLLCLIVFISGLTRTLHGQDALESGRVWRYRHEIGFSAGATSGLGPTWRIWVNRLGAQVNFFPFRNQDQESYRIGYTFFYNLLRTPVSTFFIYQGNNFRTVNIYQQAVEFRAGYYQVRGVTRRNRYGDCSLGLGYEMFRRPGKFNPIGLSIMAGLGGYDNLKIISYSAEISVLYKFNKDKYFRNENR